MLKPLTKLTLNLMAAFCWAAGSAALMYCGWTDPSALFVVGVISAILCLLHFFTEVLD